MLIEVRGLRMHVEVSGAGAPLLYLHGATEYIGYSDELVRRLAGRFRVVQPEQQGHGRTPDRPGPIHYSGMASDTIALIEAMQLQRPHIVGFSDGGILAIEMAMRRPELIGGVVAIGTNVSVSGFTAEAQAWLAEVRPVTWYPEHAAVYAQLSPDGAGHWPEFAQKVIAMARSEPEIPLAELGRITSPVLIMGADHDLIRLEHLVDVYRAIPSAQLCIVPNASHELTVEAPELVSALILRFLVPNEAEGILPEGYP